VGALVLPHVSLWGVRGLLTPGIYLVHLFKEIAGSLHDGGRNSSSGAFATNSSA